MYRCAECEAPSFRWLCKSRLTVWSVDHVEEPLPVWWSDCVVEPPVRISGSLVLGVLTQLTAAIVIQHI